MKFEFDSNNATELRAVGAAVAVLLGKQTDDDHLEAAAHHVSQANRMTASDTHRARFKNAEGIWTPWVGLGGGLRTENVEVESTKGAATQHVDETHLALPVDTSRSALVKDGYQERQPAGLIHTHAPELTGEALASHIEAHSDEPQTDSAGQPWNPELHSSSRAKVADGTWKKKRGARSVETLAKESGLTQDEVAERLAEPLPPATRSGDFTAEQLAAATPPVPPVPPAPAVPTPPAPQADGLVTMNDIWALITSGKTTINVVLAAAQSMGFADLGKVAQTATAEQRAALLKELTA